MLHQLLVPHPKHFYSVFLFLLALANYGLMYAAHMGLARALTVNEFDDYSVALSVVAMLSTVATLGLEKYALRAVALFRERQDWPRFRGFWLFSLRTIGGFSLLLMAILGISLETALAWYEADYHAAIIVYASFLPVIAMTLFLVEVIAAQGAFLLSVTLYRLLLPVVYLLLLTGLSFSPVNLSALTAVTCFGSAWTAILAVMWRVNKALTPPAVALSKPAWRGKTWIRRSLPLVLSSLMLTVMTSGGVVIMELLFPSSIEVGIYAIAVQTGGFISLVGTSTNRYYLPVMVVLMEHRDKQSIRRLMRQRALVVGGLILMILLTIFFYGDKILGLFGTHFNAGYDALVIIAVGASISALYADIPYYLQFMGRKRSVFNLTAAAALTMVMLSFLLGPELGPVGVALAYMTPVVALFIALRIIVSLHFRRL